MLPDAQSLGLDRIQRDEQGFVIEVSTHQIPRCPDCGKRSHSLHSHYQRHLQDLPWQGVAVRLRLKARRFRCRNPACCRKIFVERLPQVAVVYGRHTERLQEIVRCVGFVAGGLPGSRLLARLAIAISDDTVLRLVKLSPVTAPKEDPVRCLGIDDWAWRKGQNYGTILVDLDRHCVVDLLPDRSADELADWLAQHPTVSVISRDRLGLYAEGAASGAPNAQQVADRFHLVLNLSGAIQRALEEHSRQLLLAAPSAVDDVQATLSQEPTPPPLTQNQIRRQQQRQRRLELYEKVMQLHGEGHSQRAIGTALQIQRKTVRRWVRAGEFPERKRSKPRASKVYQFADHLRQRWTEGCHNATKLCEEIKKQGYRGQRGMVAQFVAGWRSSKRPPPSPHPRRVSATQVAILATRGPDQLTAEQRSLLKQLCSTCPQLLCMRTLALNFREALFSKDGQQMRQWITAAKHCGIGSLVRFAFGLQKDLSAVLAAVETSYSNGQVEGQVNRLKMIKRQMYGRAGFRLLLSRILPYTSITGSMPQRAP